MNHIKQTSTFTTKNTTKTFAKFNPNKFLKKKMRSVLFLWKRWIYSLRGNEVFLSIQINEIIDVTSGHIKLDELLRGETTKSVELSILHIYINIYI